MKTVEHRVGVREVVASGTVLACAKVFLGVPRTFAIYGGTAAWMVALLTMSHGPIMLWSMQALLRRYPGKSLVYATEAVLGPFFGTIVNLLYSFYFTFLTIAVIREFGDAIVLAFLPRTPLPVLVMLLLLAATYAANLGLEPLARTAWLGGPAMLVGLVVLLIAGIATHTQPHPFAPFWGTGAYEILRHGLTYNVLGDLLLFGIVAPGLSSPKQWSKAFWLTLLLTAFIFVSTEMAYLIFFPYPAATRIILPLMQISRTISLGPGVQRVEGFFFVIWGSGGILKLAFAVYGAGSTLAQTLRLPSHRHLLGPLAILIFYTAMIPRNITLAYYMDQALRIAGGLITVLMPLLTALMAWALQKGGKQRAAG